MNHTGLPIQNPTVVAIIPARYSSSRLPGKPLLEIQGRPMVLHVVERALAARRVVRAVVATDDERIFDAVRAAGREALMTSAAHASGSDRLAEAAAQIEADIVVNVQGDEPLIAPETIERAVEALLSNDDASAATTCEPIESASDVLSSDVVKVVTDERGRAIYFSRSPVPFPRDAVRRYGSLLAALEIEPALLATFRKHTGLYVYRRAFLLEYARWPQTALERAESLEQLRILERGHKIVVVEAAAPSVGVDTEEDLRRVREIMEQNRER
ncbi:MAG TPA: 3-deoxy-manno-octulosonate cytidylyltransferase [Pyrinomonadaceae bacterium]|nr:3-deoxy-manno-octulosonate cytidylyltransferase [Pyrinomonadaceae bacterium]